MAKKHQELKIHLTVNYVPLPPEHKEAWKEGMRLLVRLLMEEPNKIKDLHGVQEVGGSNPKTSYSLTEP